MLCTSRPKLHAPNFVVPLGCVGSNVVSTGASITLLSVITSSLSATTACDANDSTALVSGSSTVHPAAITEARNSERAYSMAMRCNTQAWTFGHVRLVGRPTSVAAQLAGKCAIERRLREWDRRL